MVSDLGVDVHPLGDVEPAAVLRAQEFLISAVPVDVGGDQHEETLRPGVRHTQVVLDVQAVTEGPGEQEAGAGQQCVADGVGVFEGEQFHRGPGQDH